MWILCCALICLYLGLEASTFVNSSDSSLPYIGSTFARISLSEREIQLVVLALVSKSFVKFIYNRRII